MSIDPWSYGVGGIVATSVLTGVMYAAQEAGWSRMSMPFLIGSMWSTDRRRARLLGLAAHVASGMGFALLYVAGFEILAATSWWLGAIGGLAHAFVILTVGMKLASLIHPHMADARRGPEPTTWLQPPGFLALNYGRRTPIVAALAHIAFGAILGTFYRL